MSERVNILCVTSFVLTGYTVVISSEWFNGMTLTPQLIAIRHTLNKNLLKATCMGIIMHSNNITGVV